MTSEAEARGGARRARGVGRAFVATCALVTGAALAGGCDGGKRTEARSLLAAVERYQRAENAQRPAMAAELARLPCTAPEVAPACAACMRATGSMGRAIALKGEVEGALDAFDAGRLDRAGAAQLDLAGKLGEAARLLDEARAAMPDCEEHLNAMRRTLAL